MASVEKGAYYANTATALTSGVKADVLAAPASPSKLYYTITHINLCAGAAGAGTADIVVYNAANTTEYPLKKAAVIPAADSYALVDTGPIVLKAGDALRVTANVANVTARVSFLIAGSGPSEARLG